MQETWVQFLGQKDPLEKGMAPYSRILAWKNEWAEKPGGLRSAELQRVGHDWAHTPTFLFIGDLWLMEEWNYLDNAWQWQLKSQRMRQADTIYFPEWKDNKKMNTNLVRYLGLILTEIQGIEHKDTTKSRQEKTLQEKLPVSLSNKLEGQKTRGGEWGNHILK